MSAANTSDYSWIRVLNLATLSLGCAVNDLRDGGTELASSYLDFARELLAWVEGHPALGGF